MTERKHTELPWESGGLYVSPSTGEGLTFSGGDVEIYPPLGNSGPVAVVSGIDNAMLIVQSVNNHHALIEALEGLLMSADCEWENQRLGHDWAEACEKARATLKQAKGESGD